MKYIMDKTFSSLGNMEKGDREASESGRKEQWDNRISALFVRDALFIHR